MASSDFDSSANTPNAFARLRSQHRLPDGTRKMGEAWWKFHDFVKATPDLPIGTLISFAVTQPMTPEVIAAYDAPFPDVTFKAGARTVPVGHFLQEDSGPELAARLITWMADE